MGDETALARVIRAIGCDETMGAVGGGVVEGHILGHGLVALAVAVDVFPGIGVGEG